MSRYHITCDVPVFDDSQDTFLERRYYTGTGWSMHQRERAKLDFRDALRECERLRVINPFGIRNVTVHQEGEYNERIARMNGGR